MKYAISITVFVFLAFFFFVKFDDAFAPAYFQKPDQAKPVVSEKAVTVVVVGDMMLGRFVEDLAIRNHDWNYSFASTSGIFAGADLVFGNFESALPKEHVKTPVYGYQFSVRKEMAEAAKRAGVNVVTLANNHSSDFGAIGYEETVSALNEIGIATIGKHSDYLYERDGIKVIFMGLDDTLTRLSTSTIAESVRSAKKENEFLIAAVHFGEEYATTSNARQKVLAYALIDAGADVVIGHHSHSVQELEKYNGKPIFYSLGNFIFDQYFSEETQRGLAVRITIEEDGARYEILPVNLAESRPRPDVSEKLLAFTAERGK
ncbi:MAG: CapA family protein [Candidatus Paceibacterota bacterium]|jgi:poly-gamma-glutamate synthesis protein (capsule biosynthesis protein)